MAVKKNAIFKVQPVFWEEFGIFPSALAKRADTHRVQQDTNKALLKLGQGNLAMLCERFLLPVGQDQDKSQLAAALQSGFSNNLLTHAIEFSKKRSREIEEVFEKEVPSKERTSAAERVRTLGSFREALSTLAKTLLLLNQSEAHLREVFYLASWQSKDTKYRFAQESHTNDRFAQLIEQHSSELTKLLQKTTNQGGELLGIHTIKGKLLVLVYLREYRPKVSRDYKSKLNLHHSCGTLVMGLNFDDGFFHLKAASKDIAAAVESFFREKLKIEVVRTEDQVESNFDPKPLAELLKGTPPKSTIRITGIAFKRAAIGGVPLTIPLSPFNDQICTTLNALSNASIITYATPVNIASMDVAYKDTPIHIEAEIILGGAMRFLYQNHGIRNADQRDFEIEFQNTWGLPLNKLLDPTQWRLGTGGIVSSILKSKHVDEIEEYQKTVYNKLRELGIIEEKEETIWRCSNYSCGAPVLKVFDDHPCRTCGAQVREIKIREIAVNEQVIRDWVRKFLDTRIGWKLKSQTASVEKKEYWPLLGNNPDSQRLATFFQHNISTDVLETFDRSQMPIVRFTNQSIDPPVRTERDTSVSVSIPHLLASEIEGDELPQLDESLKRHFENTANSYDIRISKAAQVSVERLALIPSEQDGDRYEVDVYNVLHWLFWFTTRLGRKGVREPDGLISLQAVSRLSGEVDAPTWTIAYDAKFSNAAKGYDFGPDEQRQAREYIGKYFRAPSNAKHSKLRISGHVIISNNIETAKIAAFTQYLRSEGIIVTDKASPAIALIRDGFITTLYKALAADQELYRQKRLHLHGYLINLLRRKSERDFIELTADAASWILDNLKKQEPIEDGITVKQFDESIAVDIPSELFLPRLTDTIGHQSGSQSSIAQPS